MLIEQLHLEADETVLRRVRKHWFVLFAQMASLVIIGLLPLLLYAGSMYVEIGISISESYNLILSIIYILWLICTWMGLFNVFTNYYLDVWTITNKRLLAVDQDGFFRRTSASLRFDRLQDISTEVNGIVATVLNYGALTIQSAGNEGNFKENGLPNPDELKSIILDAADKLTDRKVDSGTDTPPIAQA